MIPRKIEIHNLGAIPYACIDLTNVSLAAVIGPNGAGKTTGFTIAPMFALFGTTKNGCSVDDMVRTGATEMNVNFEFEHRAEIYRVNRGRSIKGRGKSTLDLQHLDDGQWVSESGTTIRETEEKIKAFLNLDADTFAATSMILQGRANEFTAKPPGQRKAVLTKALGLEQYDRLQEKAKEKAATTKARLDSVEGKVAELDMRLTARARLESELAVAVSELAVIGETVAAKEAECTAVEQHTRSLEVKTAKAGELGEQITKVNGELTKSRELCDVHQKRLDSASKMLEQKENILTRALVYEETREKVLMLQAKQPRLRELSNEQSQVETELAGLDEEIKRLNPQIKSLHDVLANREVLQQATTDYREAMASLKHHDKLGDEWTGLNTEVHVAERKVARWDAESEAKLARLESAIEARRGQADTMDTVSCKGTAMAETCLLLAEARKAAAEINAIETDLAQVHASVNPYTKEWQSLLMQRDALGYDQQKHNHIKGLTVKLVPMAEQAALLESKSEQLEILKDNNQRARGRLIELNVRLSSIKQSAQALGAELQPLDAMEVSLPNLKKWADAKDKLPVAEQVAVAAGEALEQVKKTIKTSEEYLKQLEAEHRQLLLESTGLTVARENERNLRGYIKSLQVKQNELYGQVGGIKAQLKALDEAAEERRRLVKEMVPLAKELTRWQTLVKAFGRDGIPALIIENAVPELERISNEILGQMSNGKHSVRFDTQRELKSVKGAVAETLDIIVNDWAGERPYETFSGGEQLRIDFAIRFALAELLARRAGSRVEWLTVDEGLGSQDNKHRALVLEAIKAVADRFRVTLVITHIEEAQAVFDQRIYFETRDGGVDVMVA